jgi:hypothetical protein
LIDTSINAESKKVEMVPPRFSDYFSYKKYYAVTHSLPLSICGDTGCDDLTARSVVRFSGAFLQKFFTHRPVSTFDNLIAFSFN